MITSSLRLSLACGSLFLALTSDASAAVTEKFSQTYALAANGTLSLENMNGSIDVVAWDKAEVSVEAVKSAKDEDRLRDITIEVDAQPSRLVIKTKFPKTGSFFGSQGSVRYTLKVPAELSSTRIDSTNANITVTGVRGAVELDTTNGAIKATGLASNASLDSTNGTLTAEFASLEHVHEVDLDTTNGQIKLVLPKGSSAHIDADTTNGRVNIEQSIKVTKAGKREVVGQIGEGGPDIDLDTTNGSISVSEAR